MKYFSEAILLTKQRHIDELKCWLDWHINVIGFDHIVLLDNNSPIKIKSIIQDYPKDKIDYRLIKNWPNQYNLYNEYLKRTQAQWSIPLDDDEFLYIGDYYKGSVNYLISELSKNYKGINKFYALWVNMFSQEFNKTKSDLSIITDTCYSYEACNKLYKEWPEDNGIGKCFINTGNYRYHYEYCRNSHIPKCIDGNNDTILINDKDTKYIVKDQRLQMSDNATINKNCFIAHYQFKSDDDWQIKCSRGRADTYMNVIKNNTNVYKNLYKYKDSFKQCTLLKDKWDLFSTTN